MLRSRLLHIAALVVALVGFTAVSRAEAQVSVSVTDAAVVIQDGVADATFKLQVSNGAASGVSNVWVALPDGTSTWLGDLAAGESTTSASESHRFDVSGLPPTHNTPIPVTIKFSLDGADVEQAAILVLRTQ